MTWLQSMWGIDDGRLGPVAWAFGIGVVCFLANWWMGHRRRGVESSGLSRVLRSLEARRPKLFALSRTRPTNRFQERFLEETRERVRQRSFWNT